MPDRMLTSTELSRDWKRATTAARQGPVRITTRGQETHVLVSFEHYCQLVGKDSKILAAEIFGDQGDLAFGTR
jgi:hypothetical protein